MLRLEDVLQGLIDGSKPLPRPYPQRLSFPKDPDCIKVCAGMAAAQIQNGAYDFRADEAAHLLFKMAAWCTKKGAATPDAIEAELIRVFVPIDMALTGAPHWLKSRAGIAWAERRYLQWQREARAFARAHAEEPPCVAELDFLPPEVCAQRLVELTTPTHVYEEGKAMRHCMGWSVNVAVFAKHGYPEAGDPALLECLSYAIKIRSGEVRIFSVRNFDGRSAMTLCYHVKDRRIEFGEEWPPIRGAAGWSAFRCAAAHAVSKVVPVERVGVFRVKGHCRDTCPKHHAKFCESIKFAFEGMPGWEKS